MYQYQYIILVAVFFSFNSAVPLTGRIVGGEKATDGQFPYQISLRNWGYHSCGGSIISELWILTAAHCVYMQDSQNMDVVAGTNKLNSIGEKYVVLDYVYHDYFTMQYMHHDIALMSLKEKIKFNEKVQPIPLNTVDFPIGSPLILSGWGLTSYPGNVSNDLQYIPLLSITSEECQDQLYPVTHLSVDDNQVCTFTASGEGACQGDSGGPLVYEGRVAGIVSWGQPCAVGYPDVFTKVSKYINWIDRHIVN